MIWLKVASALEGLGIFLCYSTRRHWVVVEKIKTQTWHTLILLYIPGRSEVRNLLGHLFQTIHVSFWGSGDLPILSIKSIFRNYSVRIFKDTLMNGIQHAALTQICSHMFINLNRSIIVRTFHKWLQKLSDICQYTAFIKKFPKKKLLL